MEEKGVVKLSSSQLLKSLETELEQLDADEYELPKVPLPTLDSILKEDSNEDESDTLADENEFGRLLSTFDTESLSSFDDPDRRRKRKIYEGHGSVMRHSVLKGISQQIVSAQTRINAGLPTAMAVDMLFAIGTVYGIVYVFEPSQAMKWSLGTVATGEQYGAVSSICFNVDCTRLLVGYAKGHITMWDLTNGKLLRCIADAHPLGQAVLHVKFTGSLTVALCSDSGGSVFDLEFTRSMTGRGCTSRCIFSGSRGEVCAMEPLHTPPNISKKNANTPSMLVALVTFTKVLVINLRPEVKIIFSFLLPGEPDSLPLMSWRYAGIKIPGQKSILDPVLAVARQSTMHFFQAIIRPNQDIVFQKLQTSEVPYRLIAFCWLNSNSVCTMDNLEKVHIIDIKSWEELEVIDLSDMMFVYGTSFFKGLATGGNVSPALSYAGEFACYYSMSSYRAQLFVLGSKSVHVMTLRTWTERLEVLLRENRHQDALALAFSFYDGSAKAVIGLPHSEDQKRQIVQDKMLEILYEYIDLSMTKLCPEFGRIDELINHYENVVPTCVEYCLRLNRVDVLFGRLYERFGQDVIAHGAFLECLEPFILEDSLKAVSPQIIKDLIRHYQCKGILNRVEACLVHLDIISLDIHETVKLCRDNGMYDAVIYIYNQGLHDYVSPLQELTLELWEALKSGKQLSDDLVKLGNKLLVYISNSLAGLAYPIGSLPDGLVSVVKTSIFRTLTSQQSASPTKDDRSYPYLRTLLDFDTREFLNVLALAFEEDDFSVSNGTHLRQFMVDILLQLMVDGAGYSPKQIGMLYTFLARQLARHSETIHVSKGLFDQILEYLCRPGDDSHREERQEALLELLNVDTKLQIDSDRLLIMAEHANLFRVCEYLYKKRQLHDKILMTYLNDPSRCHQAFSFIRSTLANKQAQLVNQKMKQVTLANLVPLVECDASQTATLLVDVLKVDVVSTIYSLENQPQTQYKLLREIALASESSDNHGLEPQLYDLLVERMCIYDKTSVDFYLKSSNAYNAESIFQICSKYHMYDSMTYLLEKLGQINEAFLLMMKSFKEKIELYIEQINDKKASKHVTNVTYIGQQVEALLLKIIGLCQKSQSKLSDKDREKLWFELLDSVVEPQRRISESDQTVSQLFKDASNQVMNCMMGSIPLPAVMKKIVEDFSFSNGRFGDVKDLLLGMLDTYNYEKTLMSTVCNMVEQDLLMQIDEQRQLLNHAFVPARDSCGYCKRHVTASDASVELRIFRCGHMFHQPCLEKSGSYTYEENEKLFICFICKQSQYNQQTSMRGISNTSAADTANNTSTQVSGASLKAQERRMYKQKNFTDITLKLTPPSLIDNEALSNNFFDF